MDDQQESNLNRHQLVVTVCDEFADDILGKPALSRIYASYKTGITDTEAVAASQGRKLTGIKDDKEMAKDKAAEAVAEIMGYLQVFAKETGNNALLKEAKVTQKGLTELKDGDFAPRCYGLLQTAEAHQGAAADYGVSEKSIMGATALIGIYKDLVPAPKKALKERKADTGKLRDGLKTADGQLDSMTKLMAAFKKEKPEFYSRFVNASALSKTARKKKLPTKVAAKPA